MPAARGPAPTRPEPPPSTCYSVWSLLPAASLAGFVLGAGIDRPVDSAGVPLFGDDAWGLVVVLLPFGAVGLFLIVRSAWRLARAVFGRPVAAPMLAAGYPAPPYPVR